MIFHRDAEFCLPVGIEVAETLSTATEDLMEWKSDTQEETPENGNFYSYKFLLNLEIGGERLDTFALEGFQGCQKLKDDE